MFCEVEHDARPFKVLKTDALNLEMNPDCMSSACTQWFLTKMHLLKRDTAQLVVLIHVSSILKPGRLTLLLGPPASGRSTLLKALANKLDNSGLLVWHRFNCHKSIVSDCMQHL